ncbi:MAG TPA: nucleoside 2-deoxyribosyltransferase domain-containing protein [Blastocatellia bacterium]|nr:nucleoside 2-deoxyribosyltransferase domain-containing protein [Blastocatellia bacterium]
MLEIKAPGEIPVDGTFLFLAGSIEMGGAGLWQARAAELLAHTTYTILNPRRDDWDSSWVQSIDNPQFRQQVEWELEGLKRSDRILFYFEPGTKSPITLLELGLLADSKKLIVVCPDGFWRKGNVDIVCHRYGIEQAETLEDACERLGRSLIVPS